MDPNGVCGAQYGHLFYCPTSGIEQTNFTHCGMPLGKPCSPPGSPCVSGTWQIPEPEVGFKIESDKDGNNYPTGEFPKCLGPGGTPLVAKKCCGEQVMGENECCLPSGKVVPAYPVQNFAECPDLQQDPAHPPTSNGYGPAND